jgi:outer membrane protein
MDKLIRPVVLMVRKTRSHACRIFLLAASAGLWLAAPAGVAHAQGKIGVVQIERIVRDSAPALRAQKKLEAEFAKREAELTKVADQVKRMQDELEISRSASATTGKT